MFARTSRILLWIASIVAVAGYVTLASMRIYIANPPQPEEAVMLEHAQRVLRGEAMYQLPPHGAGAPLSPGLPLMPGMPLVVSGLMYLFGDGLWAPRLVTLLATLAVAALALWVVRTETKSGILGMVSAGILLAGLSVFTLREGAATPEPLALAFGIAGLAVLRFSSGWWSVLLSAALLSVGFFIHPLAGAFFIAATFALMGEHRAHCLVFVLAGGVLMGGGYVLLSERLGPWFNFSAIDGPLASLRFRPLVLLHAIGDELLGRFGVLTFSGLLAFALPGRPWRGPAGLWMWSAFAVILLALASTQTLRVTPQDLSPALVALCIVGPISAQRVTQHLSAWPGSSRLGGQGVVLVALMLQFVMLLAGASAALLPSA